jgi:hypothetical protein
MKYFWLILLLPTFAFASAPKEKEPDCRAWQYRVLKREATTQDEMSDEILEQEIEKRWQIYALFTKELILIKKTDQKREKVIDKCITANVQWRALAVLRISREQNKYDAIPLFPTDKKNKALKKLTDLKTFHHLIRNQFRNMAGEKIKFMTEKNKKQ